AMRSTDAIKAYCFAVIRFLLVDGDRRAGGGGAKLVETGGDGAGQGVEAAGGGGGFALGGYRLAGVAADADAGINFDFAENRDAVGLGGFCSFAMAEDVTG